MHLSKKTKTFSENFIVFWNPHNILDVLKKDDTYGLSFLEIIDSEKRSPVQKRLWQSTC